MNKVIKKYAIDELKKLRSLILFPLWNMELGAKPIFGSSSNVHCTVFIISELISRSALCHTVHMAHTDIADVKTNRTKPKRKGA